MEHRRVLLMDDEIASADVVRAAIRALAAAGLEVEATDRMSAVRESFYAGSHDAYVLDIDMSQVSDVVSGDGTTISRFLRSMDLDARVVIFSARGGVPAWLAAANHHVQGYVHKSEPGALERLAALVRRALEEPPAAFPPPRRAEPPRRALLAVEEPFSPGAGRLASALAAALPGWEVENAAGLERAADAMAPDRFGVALVAADRFSTRPGARALMERICAGRGLPNVIFACRGETGAMASILQAVNARPFRLLDTLDPDLDGAIAEAVSAAVAWYGKHEVLRAEDADLERLELGFSEETREALGLVPGEPAFAEEDSPPGDPDHPPAGEEHGGGTR